MSWLTSSSPAATKTAYQPLILCVWLPTVPWEFSSQDASLQGGDLLRTGTIFQNLGQYFAIWNNILQSRTIFYNMGHDNFLFKLAFTILGNISISAEISNQMWQYSTIWYKISLFDNISLRVTIYHCREECFNFWADISLSETIFSNCKESPRQTLFKHFLSYFQNIVFVDPGFEGSKFLHKCWSP